MSWMKQQNMHIGLILFRNTNAKHFLRLNPDVYWTGERLIKAPDKFDIFIALKNNEVIGAVITSNLSKKAEEIYFLEVAQTYKIEVTGLLY